MIEIVCNDDKGNPQNDNQKSDSGQALKRKPKNIKQIGDVSSDKKIYIEDYAFTYNNINYIEYNGNRKFCNQSIGAQRYNKLYLFDEIDYVDFWNQNIYTGRTSKQFLKTCTPRPPE